MMIKNGSSKCRSRGARKVKAPVIVAKLDGLGQDVHFISGLMKQKVAFIVADLGADTDRFMLHLFAAQLGKNPGWSELHPMP